MTTLVCFAVPEEARPFQRKLAETSLPEVQVLVTGMGRENSLRAVERTLKDHPPGQVITCGFAGGLDPAWPSGTVLYEGIRGTDLAQRLESAGARRGRFTCVETVAVTATDKARLRGDTQADAVEMESGHITRLCERAALPCATVRVILDPAAEDLPLDFNAILTPEKKIHFGKLAWWVATHPGRIPGLMRLQKQTQHAAEQLAEVLVKALSL